MPGNGYEDDDDGYDARYGARGARQRPLRPQGSGERNDGYGRRPDERTRDARYRDQPSRGDAPRDYQRDDRSRRAPSYPDGHADAYRGGPAYAGDGHLAGAGSSRFADEPERYGQSLGGGRNPGRPPGVAMREPKQKGRKGVFIALGLVVLLVLVGGGALIGPRLLSHVDPGLGAQVSNDPYTPLAGPSPTPPANFTAYASTRIGYSLDYPTGWSKSQETETVQGQPDDLDVFLQSTQSGAASFYVEQSAAAANVSDEQVIASEVGGAQQNGVTLTPIAGLPATAAIGGVEWQRADYTVTASGATSHEVILACHHANHSFVIVYIAPTSAFDTDLSTYFTPLLRSFRFAN